LPYAVDRQPLVPRLVTLARTLDELEMLELNLSRLKAEQKARKERHDQRIKEFANAKPTHKQLAEKLMAESYDRLKEINVQLRAAEARYHTRKNMGKGAPKATTRPDGAGFRIMMSAHGSRDNSIDVNIFCDEHDADRLMAAPKNSLVKVRGWISDIALSERLATMGYRIDHAEILAVNVEDPIAPRPPLPTTRAEPKADPKAQE
ncbi:MAG: hypothetical protein PHU85_19255, partial [Phycisphaerae bacterium]|nr:hypothetical protein [Phycisphaerae bacterium]